MHATIFYSWQSWLPNSTNRGFIQSALEKAAEELRADDTIDVEPVIDRDTADLPGSPEIAASIFNKVDRASVFVGDITNVVPGGARPGPNPNVLFGAGYALARLGPERVVLVFNKAFGRVEDLPFDLRARRVLVYECVEGAPKSGTRTSLTGALASALKPILASLRPPPPAPSDVDRTAERFRERCGVLASKGGKVRFPSGAAIVMGAPSALAAKVVVPGADHRLSTPRQVRRSGERSISTRPVVA